MVQFVSNNTGGETRLYECRECLNRITAEEHRAICPKCRGELRNITVPRE